ncbi:MAG: aminoacyl-tRNA hydrolase [Terriglobia bacterium]
MRLIVGLGNPGTGYRNTPHNLGFRVIDRLAGPAGVKRTRRREPARTARARLEATEVVLAQPETFMNASGLAVAALLERYRLTPEALIVIADDVALPWGTLRIREQGSAGGHKGLESVISALDTQEFVRVRLGIRPAQPVEDLTDYVLAPIPAALCGVAEALVGRAAEAVQAILREGTKKAMTHFNRRAPAGAGAPEAELPARPAGGRDTV